MRVLLKKTSPDIGQHSQTITIRQFLKLLGRLTIPAKLTLIGAAVALFSAGVLVGWLLG